MGGSRGWQARPGKGELRGDYVRWWLLYNGPCQEHVSESYFGAHDVTHL